MTPTLCHCGRHKDRCRCADGRREALEDALRIVPGTPDGPMWYWTDGEIARLQAAYRKRFGEDLPRSETLHSVAAEGMRILRDRIRAIANGAP